MNKSQLRSKECRPFSIRIYDRLGRFTSGIEIDEMLADFLFIYALMGALQAAFLTIHLINPHLRT